MLGWVCKVGVGDGDGDRGVGVWVEGGFGRVISEIAHFTKSTTDKQIPDSHAYLSTTSRAVLAPDADRTSTYSSQAEIADTCSLVLST